MLLGASKWLLLATVTSLTALRSAGQSDNFAFHTQASLADSSHDQRMGKDLLDWIGLGTGPEKDPYLARTNAACLNGDLAECFKSRALGSLDEFFSQEKYDLTENARVIRMPVDHLRSIASEPFEFSSEARSDEPEWDQLVKYALRKVEKFLKSTALEVQFPEEVTEHGRYSPRFVDEIADELDIIEDKKDTRFSRKKLRKLIIPFLIVLKLFKLKLLLFLPLILGLASFKKLLGFFAIIIPGLIGFFKLCKPDLTHNPYFGSVPQYSPAGIGIGGSHHRPSFHPFKEQPSFASRPEYAVYGGNQASNYHYGYKGAGNGISFREDPQNLAYSEYSEYRSAKEAPEAETKKSILPDS